MLGCQRWQSQQPLDISINWHPVGHTHDQTLILHGLADNIAHRRLEGTNVEKGKEIIANSGLNVIAADDLKDGAEKIVKAVKG